MISVMFPSRNRPEECKLAIASIFDTAEDPDGIEVLVALDDDDVRSTESLREIASPNIQFVVGPRYGYPRLHDYLHRLYEHRNVESEWMLPFNDDAEMSTQGWDSIVHEYDGRFVVLTSSGNRTVDYGDDAPRAGSGPKESFPIIPTRWVDITGRWAAQMSYDTWVCDVARSLGSGVLIDDPRIIISHSKLVDTQAHHPSELEKQTSIRSYYGYDESAQGNVAYYTYDMNTQRMVDADLIAQSGILLEGSFNE